MDVKQTTTMIIGMAVAVILVAGLMVPVISSLDSGTDDGETLTNTGTVYYTPVENNSTTISLTTEQVIEMKLKMTIDGGTAKELGPEWTSENAYTSSFYPILFFTDSNNRKGVEGVLFSGDDGEMDAIYLMYRGGALYVRAIFGETGVSSYYLYSVDSSDTATITVNNGTVTYDFPGGSVPAINGTYDYVVSDTSSDKGLVLSSSAQVFADTDIIAVTSNGEVSITSDEETGDALVLDGSSFAYGSGNVENLATGMKVWGSNDTDTFTLTSTDEDGTYTLTSLDSTNHTITSFIVPVQIGGDGDGTSVPPTLMAMLSVIPLITVVGIVVGAVGFLRMKGE